MFESSLGKLSQALASMHLRTTRRLSAAIVAVGLASFAQPTWAQRELQNIPDPSPAKELESFEVVEGFTANLFIADPEIAKPIHMNFDADGKLWIASSEVYPHIKPGAPATDKILVCEDTDGDGVADKTTVFADGLLIPTGIAPGDGGCYVANSTELIHLADTDGDGKADRKRVILSGFGTEDTHHLLHSLRWGPDGCLYMNQSIYIHSHIETPYGVRRMNGGGIWRFRPETMELEVLCLGFVNPWGHHFDYWGQSFATDGAYGEGINYVFPGSVFVTSPGATRIMHGLNPGSPKHCGLEILSGRHLPESWTGSMVANDFRANRVCRFVVTDDRSAYQSRQEAELIRTNHVAFRPIDVKMGPDGAIYIADWYNPIIQHGEVDFRDDRRDHVHGRVWRLTANGRETLKHPRITGAPIEELLELLRVPEDWVRLYSKLEMKARGATEVVPALEKWIANLDPSSPQFEHDRLEALWVYQNLNLPNLELLAAVAASPQGEARAAAIRVAVDWQDALADRGAAMFERAISDEHPRVRLEAVRALSTLQSPQAAEVATRVLDAPMDEFLDFALWKTLRDLSQVWLPELLQGRLQFGGNVSHLTYALKAVDAPAVMEPLIKLAADESLDQTTRANVLVLAASQADANGLDQVLNLLDSIVPDPSQRMNWILTIARSTVDRRVVPASGSSSVISALSASDNPQSQLAALEVAGIWQLDAATEVIAKIGSSTSDDQLFAASATALAKIASPSARERFASLVGASPSPARRAVLVGEATRFDLILAINLCKDFLVEAQSDWPIDRALAPVLAQAEGPARLTAALAEAKLSADVARLAVRVARSAPRPDEQLIERLRAAGSLAESGWVRSDALVAELVAEVATSGDPARGEAIYRRSQNQCVNCHAIAGAGGKVGPDLLSIGASAPVDYLIDSLLVPNDKVKEGYHAKVIQTDSGELFTGIVVTEADGIVTLRQADGKLVRVPSEEIIESVDGRSLMPDGTVDELTRQELVDLVTFLSRLGKVGDYSIGNRTIVRRFETLVWTQEAHNRLNRTSHDTAATDDPAFLWRSVTSRVVGDLPMSELDRFSVHPGIPPTSFVRFELQVTAEGNVTIDFAGAKGIALWINGDPTPIESRWSGSLPVGRHEFMVTVDTTQTEALTAEVIESELPQASVRVLIEE